MQMSSLKRSFHASSPTPSNSSFSSKKKRFDGGTTPASPAASANGLARHLAGQVNQVVEWLKAKPGPHRLDAISIAFLDMYADGGKLMFTPEMIQLLQTYTGVSWNGQLELLEYRVSLSGSR